MPALLLPVLHVAVLAVTLPFAAAPAPVAPVRLPGPQMPIPQLPAPTISLPGPAEAPHEAYKDEKQLPSVPEKRWEELFDGTRRKKSRLFVSDDTGKATLPENELEREIGAF